MNQIPPQSFSLSWQTIKPWLTTIVVIWLLGFVGLGWLVKSFLFLIGFFTIVPVVAYPQFSPGQLSRLPRRTDRTQKCSAQLSKLWRKP
jgi:hypothetical protein